jgi:hypothetical protein
MNSHPLHSIAVQKMCKKCEKKNTKIAGTVSRLKLVIKELNESLDRLKKEEAREGVEELLGTDRLMPSPISPISPI